MKKDRFCLITNDVETTSILNHKLRDKTGEYVLNQGMPRLLDLYDKYGVKATFFIRGISQNSILTWFGKHMNAVMRWVRMA